MSLANFVPIFERKDFSFIVNEANLEEIKIIFIDKIRNISQLTGQALIREDDAASSFLTVYYNNLISFCTWLPGNINIPNFQSGCTTMCDALEQAMGLFKQPVQLRQSISSKYARKFYNSVMGGLALLYEGIKQAFDPVFLMPTNIDRDQVARFILDKVEGLAKRYSFNTAGAHAFVAKLPIMNKLELNTANRLLVRPSAAHLRTINGWTDRGAKNLAVRILGVGKKIYFLYSVNEHADYQTRLNILPAHTLFVA